MRRGLLDDDWGWMLGVPFFFLAIWVSLVRLVLPGPGVRMVVGLLNRFEIFWFESCGIAQRPRKYY